MNMVFTVEQDLIRRARLGDESAFEQLVRAFTPDLYRVIRRMMADQKETEAILQETFWRIWQNLSRYRSDRRFFPYLVTIATNLARDAWRKERKLNPDEFESLSDRSSSLPTPENEVEEAELLRSLASAVQQLPFPYRAVIALRYEAELSYDDIASALDLPVNTVRTYLHRAKSVLHENLKEAYG
jgi:RNA polymerase sigma-70 factor, ECF subfamily